MKGIIMSGNHPALILNGTKTQTRRVLNPQPPRHWSIPPARVFQGYFNEWGCRVKDDSIKCPYGQVGDRLWFRERHKLTRKPEGIICEYIDGEERYFSWVDIPRKQRQMLNRIKTWGKWRPARFMYKFLAIHWGGITEIRVERIQSISAGDCTKEGIPYQDGDYVSMKVFDKFRKLWDSLNAKRGYGWEVNPWCWCISFKVI